MNELSRTRFSRIFLAAILLAGISLPARVSAEGRKTPAGEEFYIIASVDQSKSELLLKRPNEVTLLMKANDKTQYADEAGKPIRLSDFRAGDTVWAVSTSGTEPTAIRIRKGHMTIADLHRYYLNYPEIK